MFNPIHAARLDPDGGLKDATRIALTSGLNIEFSPAVAFNGSNYLVAWSDDRPGRSAIYAARSARREWCSMPLQFQ